MPCYALLTLTIPAFGLDFRAGGAHIHLQPDCFPAWLRLLAVVFFRALAGLPFLRSLAAPSLGTIARVAGAAVTFSRRLDHPCFKPTTENSMHFNMSLFNASRRAGYAAGVRGCYRAGLPDHLQRGTAVKFAQSYSR